MEIYCCILLYHQHVSCHVVSCRGGNCADLLPSYFPACPGGVDVITTTSYFPACPGDMEVITGDGPLPMAIFELLEYIVNEVNPHPLDPAPPSLLTTTCQPCSNGSVYFCITYVALSVHVCFCSSCYGSLLGSLLCCLDYVSPFACDDC